MVSADFPYVAGVGKGAADVEGSQREFLSLLLARECQGKKIGLLW